MRFLEKRPEWTYPVLAIYPRYRKSKTLALCIDHATILTPDLMEVG